MAAFAHLWPLALQWLQHNWLMTALMAYLVKRSQALPPSVTHVFSALAGRPRQSRGPKGEPNPAVFPLHFRNKQARATRCAAQRYSARRH